MNDESIKYLAERLLQEIEPYLILKRWLKLKEAAMYSGYGQKKLIELATRGDISGYQDPDLGSGTWIFDRDSIDKYRMNGINRGCSQVIKIVERMNKAKNKS